MTERIAVPIIGITSYLAPARWGAWDKPAALVPHGYISAVAAAGGRAVLLPPSVDAIGETLSCVSGLIFCGGPDIGPLDADASTDAGADPFERERDRAELVLLRAALALDQPVLGICRGMQLLNLAYGGTLVGHLPDVVGHDGHRRRAGRFDLHPVDTDPESTVGRILGARVTVHSGHHQGIDELGAGLIAGARAPDGSIEAVEDPRQRFAVGVLWHPEEGEDRRLFCALIDASRQVAAPAAEGVGR